jgi:hypothetical protein
MGVTLKVGERAMPLEHAVVQARLRAYATFSQNLKLFLSTTFSLGNAAPVTTATSQNGLAELNGGLWAISTRQ